MTTQSHRIGWTALLVGASIFALTDEPRGQTTAVRQVDRQILTGRITIPPGYLLNEVPSEVVLSEANGGLVAGQNEPTAAGKAMIDALVARLKQQDASFESYVFIVETHNPPAPRARAGSAAGRVAAVRVGDARGAAIKRYLTTAAPIAPERVHIESYGNSRPVTQDTSAAGQAQNHRVRIGVSRLMRAQRGGPPPMTPPVEDVPLPPFPWPPPTASAEVELPPSWLPSRDTPSTLGDVAAKLERAIGEAQYRKWSYSSVPRGFALVTQLEQIQVDGTPSPDPARWSTELPSMQDMSLFAFIRALVIAPVGVYRVIVFVATDVPWRMDGAAPTEAQAERWLSSGLSKLPNSVAAISYGRGYTTKTLVYEFTKTSASGGATFVPVSGAPALIHLDKAGILRPLSR